MHKGFGNRRNGITAIRFYLAYQLGTPRLTCDFVYLFIVFRKSYKKKVKNGEYLINDNIINLEHK